jgi:uncharacterized membrane protein YidH (DUF202 family)
MSHTEAQSRRTRIALGIAAAAVALSMFTSGFALVQRFGATTEARHNNQRVWHAVICQIEHAVYHTPRLTAQKRTNAIKFYNTLLVKDVQALPCSTAEIRGPSRATTPRR